MANLHSLIVSECHRLTDSFAVSLKCVAVVEVLGIVSSYFFLLGTEQLVDMFIQ